MTTSRANVVFSALLVLSATTLSSSRRILNGGEAQPGEWPWMASLEYLGSHSCGAVLISEDWTLTAAHCVHGFENPNFYLIRLGYHDRNLPTGQDIDVVEIHKHEDYIDLPGLGLPNDICALLLAEPADLQDPWIEPARIVWHPEDHLHGTCVMTGWGMLCGNPVNPDCDIPAALQEAPINTLTKEQCETEWGTEVGINHWHICVLDDTPPLSTICSGDSGGPLNCDDGDGQGYHVAGLASWGAAPGCNADLPAAYCRVSYYCDWVKNVTDVDCVAPPLKL